jgi:hypothetical protein
MVRQLEQAYAGRVAFKTYTVDALDPGSAEGQQMNRLAQAAGFRVTPTFLVVDPRGRLVGRYEGATPYLSLRRDLEGLLAAGAGPSPARP